MKRIIISGDPECSTYPATRWSYLEDNLKRFGISFDRPCGVGSNSPGSIDVSILRTSYEDDNLGVEER